MVLLNYDYHFAIAYHTQKFSSLDFYSPNEIILKNDKITKFIILVCEIHTNKQSNFQHEITKE